jgi:uncharacterized protein
MSVLLPVGFGITVAVYGFVGMFVKADDIGIWLTRKNISLVRATGRGIVKTMPVFLKLLSYVGTAAMLRVGAGIIVHGIPPIEQWLHVVEAALGIKAIFEGSSGVALAWAVHVSILMIVGLATGFVIAAVLTR